MTNPGSAIWSSESSLFISGDVLYKVGTEQGGRGFPSLSDDASIEKAQTTSSDRLDSMSCTRAFLQS